MYKLQLDTTHTARYWIADIKIDIFPFLFFIISRLTLSTLSLTSILRPHNNTRKKQIKNRLNLIVQTNTLCMKEAARSRG